ncbi:cellulose synthase/poly-beta-1,6-N-acetylglucosamine synthase-like glycosyltransferase [Pontibacter ummariensis]|uniref:Glycosyltransferase, catalytic subunit of cellulose synthase and poly-beta-1,6-N-acetylglucosamine synthase n=1 Tax=Pontibacter ummariensis TaxID=1610492 RepID=A0A239KGT5_9BACT|nr:glycosyltransferase [Pontibacter ummariensis]PRY06418.1 cellulose synthase/poly-beta-1,6-N-acetylglucosamine synthase-like glycosyltransferase [Pontibacter ummariensis]SNT16908.1 Glycosyltransferase, catalytic subunit of cellulose synthase and poly-beta-1,6-N-acetylglucosamine synthase [Pontibacter ummariensis]
MKVSVVIPTCKRRHLLERCVKALMRQKFAATAYEVIVADNAGEAGLEGFISSLATQTDVQLRYVWAASKRGPAHARNIGWQAAKGEIIAFTDDDCIPDEHWLAEAVKLFEDREGIAVVTGRTQVPLPPFPTDYELNASYLATAEFITANCFCRRHCLEVTGGFDERFVAAWREDADLHFKLLKHRFTIVRAQEAVVVHPVRPGHFGISVRQQRKIMFDALLFKNHPELFCPKPRACVRRYYYTLGAFLLATLLTSVGYGGAATAFFCLSLFWTAMFCYERLKATSRSPLHIFEMVVTSILIPPTAIFWRIYGGIKFGVFFY